MLDWRRATKIRHYLSGLRLGCTTALNAGAWFWLGFPMWPTTTGAA